MGVEGICLLAYDDPALYQEIIEYLAMAGSEEATEYMLELLDD